MTSSNFDCGRLKRNCFSKRNVIEWSRRACSAQKLPICPSARRQARQPVGPPTPHARMPTCPFTWPDLPCPALPTLMHFRCILEQLWEQEEGPIFSMRPYYAFKTFGHTYQSLFLEKIDKHFLFLSGPAYLKYYIVEISRNCRKVANPKLIHSTLDYIFLY